MAMLGIQAHDNMKHTHTYTHAHTCNLWLKCNVQPHGYYTTDTKYETTGDRDLTSMAQRNWDTTEMQLAPDDLHVCCLGLAKVACYRSTSVQHTRTHTNMTQLTNMNQ